jgi:phenylacetate-CoA ligase
MRRIGKITGRSDDMLIIRGVNVFPTQIEELILKNPKLAPIYQLVVTRDGHLDKLDVIVEARADVSAHLSTSESDAVARELAHHIKAFVGVSTKVRVLAAGSVERSSTGKAKRVIDKRPKLMHEQPVGAI